MRNATSNKNINNNSKAITSNVSKYQTEHSGTLQSQEDIPEINDDFFQMENES